MTRIRKVLEGLGKINESGEVEILSIDDYINISYADDSIKNKLKAASKYCSTYTGFNKGILFTRDGDSIENIPGQTFQKSSKLFQSLYKSFKKDKDLLDTWIELYTGTITVSNNTYKVLYSSSEGYDSFLLPIELKSYLISYFK